MAEHPPRTAAEIQAELEELEFLRAKAAIQPDDDSRIARGIFEELIRSRAVELALALAQEPDAVGAEC